MRVPSTFELVRFRTFTRIVMTGSFAILLWQMIAHALDRIPEHIHPLVVWISGTQESIPVAYQWTAALTILSFLSLGAALFADLLVTLLLHRTRKT